MSLIDKNSVKILIVDDEEFIRENIRLRLEQSGYSADEAADGAVAIEMIRRHPYDVVITDLRMPGIPGEKVLEEAKAIYPEAIVIVMTGYGTIEGAVQAMRIGAYDFLQKSEDFYQVLFLRLERALEERRLRSENCRLRTELLGKNQFSNVIGNSAAMQQIYRLVAMVAAKPSTVLITGETGTGKELIARSIHYNGPRKDYPLVSVNCAAIPANLLEDELFGHVKGAFTGAIQHRIGRFEQANRGTLFLDEIADMPVDLQVKLLRVLQEKEFEKIGGAATVKVDVRIIAATNADLTEKARKGEFREDLYYRLNVIPVLIPPLRKRRDDVPLLIAHFTRKYCSEQQLALKRVSHEAIKALMAFDWPGNVRQLENAVEMAVALSGDRELLDLEDFPIVGGAAADGDLFRNIRIPEEGIDFNNVVSELERKLILQSLEASGGNKKRAASLLQLKRTTFVEKLKRMGWEAEVFGEEFEVLN